MPFNAIMTTIRVTFNHLLGKTQISTYDGFVKRYGYLNSAVNRNLFDSDDKYSLLASLEDEVGIQLEVWSSNTKSLCF